MIVYFRGTDTYRLRRAVDEVLTRYGVAQKTVVNLTDADGADECERVLKYPPFFQETVAVVIRGALANVETAASLYTMLDRYSVEKLSDTLVIVCQEGVPGRDSAAAKKLAAYLEKNAAEKARFETLAGQPLKVWINDFCTARRVSIEPHAIALLEPLAASETWPLALELEKLCAGARAGHIDASLVQALSVPAVQRDEFELSNTLAAHDKRGAITAIWRKLQAGEAEQLILGSVAYSLRTLLTVKDLVGRGMNAAMIAKSAGLPPFVANKHLRGANSYTQNSLESAHAAVSKLDRQSKNGQIDLRDGLFSVMINL